MEFYLEAPVGFILVPAANDMDGFFQQGSRARGRRNPALLHQCRGHKDCRLPEFLLEVHLRHQQLLVIVRSCQSRTLSITSLSLLTEFINEYVERALKDLFPASSSEFQPWRFAASTSPSYFLAFLRRPKHGQQSQLTIFGLFGPFGGLYPYNACRRKTHPVPT